MSQKMVYYFSAFLGSVVGGYVPVLWGAGFLSISSLIFSGFGAILGIIITWGLGRLERSMDFSKDYYNKETFSKIVLNNEVIREREFEDCKFVDCSFIDVGFKCCKFIGCAFVKCILSAIVPIDSLFVDASFHLSKAVGVDWTKASRVGELSFKDGSIDYSNFRMLKLPEMKILECSAKEVDFSESDLSGGSFNGSNFEGSIFSKTNLSKADFRSAKGYFIDARVNTIKKAKFSLPEATNLLNSFDIEVE